MIVFFKFVSIREKELEREQENVNVIVVTMVTCVMNVLTDTLRRVKMIPIPSVQLATPPANQHAGRRGLRGVTSVRLDGKHQKMMVVRI